MEAPETRKEFEESLVRDGWEKKLTNDGKGDIYEKDGERYVLRNDAKSTDGPTADYYKAANNKKADMKIRLQKE